MRGVGAMGVVLSILVAAGPGSPQSAGPAGQAAAAMPPGRASVAVTPGTVYSRLADAVLRTDRLIKTDPRPFFKNVESLIIVEDGLVKFEAYYHGTDRNAPHILQSQTKSVVALLLGIAIDKGYVKDEHERVSTYFPEWFNDGDALKAAVTIRDLLTMSAGFRWEEWNRYEDPDNDNRKMYESGRWLEYALSRPMARKPNTGFKYNSGCPMIVAALIEKATGMTLDAFAAKVLFEPLGIEGYRWEKDSTGLCHAGGALFLRPYDMVKIGLTVMNGGTWNCRRIVSEAWIRRVLSPYFATSLDSSRYGYFWWIREVDLPAGGTARVVSAEGAGGQKLYILPEHRLLVAFTERNYTTPQVGPIFLKESVLPALR